MLISWNVTKACNLKCKHCYRDAGKIDPAELNTQEARDLIQEIVDAGFKIVILSGGEPLLRKDIYELIKFCASFGLKTVLGTNGTLITRLVAHKLKEADIARVGISLDSADSKIHDAFRQRPGAWRAAIKAMGVCKDTGLEFQAHTTVSKQNFKELEKITDFVEEMGARAHHIFFLVPTGRGKEISDFLLLPKDYQSLLYKILQKQKKTKLELKPVCAPQFIPMAQNLGLNMRFKRGCLAGISYCCILPNGDVHPCPYLSLRIGNVREKRFSQLWKENEILIKLRGLDYKGKCADCSSKDTCGGCRARAFYILGDYMAEDPMCTFVGLPPVKC